MAQQANAFKVENRRATYDFFVTDRYTAGLSLQGWEAKAILAGRASFNSGSVFVQFKAGEAFLEGLHITPLACTMQNAVDNNVPVRSRKLLLKRRELDKLAEQVKIKGFTVVPLTLVREGPGTKIKLEIGLAKGKNKVDKRETIKQRELSREQKAL